MKQLTTLGYVIAADTLSLFIALTLAGSQSPVIRVISAVCTTGILCVMLISHAAKTAKNDLKAERQTGSRLSLTEPLTMAATASLPAVLSFLALVLTRRSGANLYPLHKLINGYFLQIFNLIQPDSRAEVLTQGDLVIMGLLTLVPAAVFITAYLLTRSGVIFPED